MADTDPFRRLALARIALVLQANNKCLKDMYGRGFTPGIAWTARNLLELSVWTRFCIMSEENAHRFYQDGARDAMGSMTLPDEMIKADRLEDFKQTRDDLLAKALDDNIEKP